MAVNFDHPLPSSASIIKNRLHTKIGGAMLLMGIIGGAILPVIFGRLIDVNSHYPQNAVLILIPFYLVLLAYSSWGYRLEDWSFQSIKRAVFSNRKSPTPD